MTSSGASSAAVAAASTLAPKTRSGIITPLGSLVEPLVYWRMTSRSGSWGGISSASGPGLPGPGSTDVSGRVGGSPGTGS